MKGQRLKLFDWFAKTRSRLINYFSLTVTILATIFIAAIFVSEVFYYFSAPPVVEVSIDRTGLKDMHIVFSIALPNLPCPNFGVDAVDSSGNMLLEVNTNIQKEFFPPRGCKVDATLSVNKVAGDFHIAFGRDAEPVHNEMDSMEAQHIHRFTPQQARDFNTNRILHMEFLSPQDKSLVPFRRLIGRRHFPMDGHEEIVLKNTARFLYFINVIPTANLSWGRNTPLYSYEYVYRLHTIPVDTSAPRFWQPGIFFKYDLEPYVVTYGQEERYLSSSVLRVIATGGGVFVVAGWFSSLFYYGTRKPTRPA